MSETYTVQESVKTNGGAELLGSGSPALWLRLPAPPAGSTTFEIHAVATITQHQSATKAPPRRSHANRAWLIAHAGQYVGRWVALRDGVLLGTANTLNELVERVTKDYGISFPSTEVMITTGL